MILKCGLQYEGVQPNCDQIWISLPRTDNIAILQKRNDTTESALIGPKISVIAGHARRYLHCECFRSYLFV
ncbi:CTP synthase [Dirofilaria immitis]